MTKPFRVLTVDGGGMRGVYSAAYLAGLLELFARERGVDRLDLGRGFDLIAGTSTGAIVGCGAAIGVSMVEIVELYRKWGKRIFPVRLRPSLRSLPQLLTRPRHIRRGAAALREALTAVLGDETVAEVFKRRGIALAIPAVEMGQQRAWVFKTPHLGGHRDDKFSLVDVCLATSAAPLFRSLAAIPATDGMGGHLVFSDGGLWANNPVFVGLLDALQMATPEQPIEVFALGTCPRPEGELIQASDVARGIIGWGFGGSVVQVSMNAQEFAYDNMARLLAGFLSKQGRSVEVFRFPTGKVPNDLLEYLSLDDTRPEAIDRLVNQARADVNITKSICDDTKNASGQKLRAFFSGIPPI